MLPEIAQSLGMGWIIKNVFNNNPLYVVMLGGVFLLIAALFMVPVHDIVPGGSDKLDTLSPPYTMAAQSSAGSVPARSLTE